MEQIIVKQEIIESVYKEISILEKLEEDRKTFAKEYADKISNLN